MLSLTLIVTTVTAAHADGIETAQQRANELRRKLDSLQVAAAKAVGELEEVHGDLERAVSDAMTAESALSDADAARDAVQVQAQDRIRAFYMSGGRIAMYASVLQAKAPEDMLTQVSVISSIVSKDAQAVDDASTSRTQAQRAVAKFEKATIARQRLQERAEVQAAEVDRLVAAQEEMLANADREVQTLLAAARQREEAERQARVEAEQARLATIATGSSTGDPASAYQPAGGMYSCPAGAGNNFVDSWHFPRSGGRVHQGTDVFAPYGSPAFAVADGVIDKWGNGGLGGITLWLRTANGDRFYYAHNSKNLAPVGTAVRAGDVVALVGDTGNAAGTPAHIHFEAHAGGGDAANPYPFLAAICGKS